MIDPIGAFNRIRDFYISYLETAFYIRDRVISRERRQLLETAGSLCTEPIIEPITRYRAADFKLHELAHGDPTDERLPGLDVQERQVFVRLALSGLFETEEGGEGFPRAKHKPYVHQAEMLRRGVVPGNPTIVTSGTGSGKTEAFLLPVFAQLAREAIGWPAPDASFLSRRWWQDSTGNPVASYTALPNRPLAKNPDGSPFFAQRRGEQRSAAVRALILYPMNALVEDQLARLRRALDSDEARSCMNTYFNGNRIFLGKYTSSTPVTGYHRDPTPEPNEYKRREGKLKKLFKAVSQMQNTYESACRHSDRDARYLFPSVDGSEMTIRWDMQEHPPDILITNTSMLNAMLAREVDAPIFTQTRDWLMSNDDAYFFLVLDELHLQRGSAGTELSFLLRLLIQRLGLDESRHRHKLRILASSASLPLEGEAGDASLQYLWDFFGSNGSWSRPEETGLRTKELWRDCVLPGIPITETARRCSFRHQPFLDFLNTFGGADEVIAVPRSPEVVESSWRAVCAELAPEEANASLESVVKICIERAGVYLENACRVADSEKSCPVALVTICRNLFGEDSEEAVRATRCLLVIRGLGDSFRTWYPASKTPPETVSFRVHLFFRSIEGLFAPALLPTDGNGPQAASRLIGSLTVERGLRFSKVDGLDRRLLELVYCECCGELFFAGMKGKRRDSTILELLPIDPDLDGLPDSATSQLFEELSAEMFGVFWPSESVPPATGSLSAALIDWRRASLDPATGVVRLTTNRFDAWAQPQEIHGYFYERNANRLDHHQRSASDPGTCVPYACPACGTSYERRKRGYRLSPLRNFRTGFAKTTQLLATEVFEVLRQQSSEAKLVSFSDSRQDAAKAALDIERRHHEDLARQILVEAIREVASGRPGAADLKAQQQQLRSKLADLEDSDPAMDELLAEMKRVRRLLATAEDPAIPLTEIVETLDDPSFQGLLPERAKLRPYLARFVKLGVHPVDQTGATTYKVGDNWHVEWYDFFTSDGAGVDWRDVPSQRNEYDEVRREIVRESLETIAQAIFNKTYFSLEETGLGYVTVPLSAVRDVNDQNVVAAYVRVLGDSYRLNENKYDTRAKDWTDVQDIGPTDRVLRFAIEVLGDIAQARTELARILAILEAQRHAGGIIHTGRLSVRVPINSDPYWRCGRCGRVHLHLGAGVCTRCFAAIGPSATGLIEELRKINFLGKRVERGEPVFRVRCEELTGQTDDPAERQRRFRGILFPAPSQLEAQARFIDLLAVTTTMEVGIDIGPLRAVFQANMPPQRFNYQQRVGRAGRRGQAFSSVMTVCRSKSHDLYYFRHPGRITGDPPPPPFLTKRQVIIARRLLRKAWLAKAFANVRAECRRNGVVYPGDDASPDIHGEFIPSLNYFDATLGWETRLRNELDATKADRDRFAGVLVADSEISRARVLADLEPDDVIREIRDARVLLANDIRDGLAHTLAEAGYLPMFGMPTRVRNLYVDVLESDDDHQRRWSTIDRDLDLAIFEFAPGSVIVKDKQQHHSIGFTGQLPDPFRPGSNNSPQELTPFTAAFGDPFWLVQCTRCGSWHRFDAKPLNEDCNSCSYLLPDDTAGECVTPAGFRTDLRPRLINENDRFGTKHRSITAEFRELHLNPGGSNMSTYFLGQARTYRLNRGGTQVGTTGAVSFTGFSVDGYSHPVPKTKHTRLTAQSVDRDLVPANGYQPDATVTPRNNVWLAAAKTTDSLFVSATKVQPGLRLERVSGDRVITSVRAAALSATFIMVHRAALDLDIDPEEFDIIDPRVYMTDGAAVPVLQITDHLVNGSGFCERLAERDAGGVPYVARMIGSVVRDLSAFPLKDYRGKKDGVDHAEQCRESCYLCLQRYGNQSYHGLLDWRLGLSFLEALDDPAFTCGLDGNFQGSPSLADWPALAKTYASALVNNYRSDGDVIEVGGLTAFNLDRKQNRWALVIHPLWDIENPSGILAEAIRQIGSPPEFADTFELSRRQVVARERLRHEWNN